MTDRIVVNRTGPSTRFILEADVVDLGVIHAYLRAENHGNTTSVDGNSGWQAGQIDGYGEWHRHSGQPFLRSGIAGGGTWRWRDGPYGIYVGDPAGGVTLRHILYYGNNDTAHLAIQPQAPSPLGFDEITSTSMRYRFSGRGNGGSGMIGWEAQLSRNPEFTDIVSHITSTGTTVWSGLQPGRRYWARSRGRNAVGLGWWSAASTAETLSGARVHDGTAYRQSIAHIWTAGGWKRAIPYVYHDGAWKIPR